MGNRAAKSRKSRKLKETRKREDKSVLAEHGQLRPEGYESEGPDAGASSQEGFISQWRQLVSPEEIIEAGCRLGVIKRQRKVDLVALAEATISAMSPIPGAQTSVLVNYLALSGVRIAPSSFYDRFTSDFAALMKDLAVRAIEMVREVSQPGQEIEQFGTLLSHFDDVQAADSSCLMLKKFASVWAPSTNKTRQAGVKLNAVISLTDQLPNAVDVTPQRQHDNKGLPEDTLGPNTLTFLDLGYIDIERFVRMTLRGAFFLSRLKTTHNPIIKRVHVGSGSRLRARGMKLDDALENECLGFKNGEIDVDVVLSHGGIDVVCRVVGISNADGDCWWYLTNVSRDTLNAHDVSVAYTLRWDIELLFKQLKSGAGLNAILACSTSAVLALIYGKIIALCVARLLELTVEEKHGSHAISQLALLLTLNRAMPLLLGFFMRERGVTLPQLEERIIMIAEVAARSRNQRRERRKRQKRQALGQAGG